MEMMIDWFKFVVSYKSEIIWGAHDKHVLFIFVWFFHFICSMGNTVIPHYVKALS